MPIGELSQFLASMKTVIDIYKGIKSQMPKGPEADRTAEQIEHAEQALEAAKAQLAKELGYTLCQCTFPPQIMLSQGRHPKRGEEIFKCPGCGKQEPSEHHFRQMDEIDAYNASLEQGPLWGRD